MKNIEILSCNIHVTGMNSQICTSRILDKLLKQDGIVDVKIDLLKEKAEIKYKKDYLTTSQIISIIQALGFNAELQNPNENERIFDFYIEGMTCSSCAYKIEKEIQKIKGIKEVRVALLTKRGTFKLDTDSDLRPSDIIHRIRKFGFKATLIDSDFKTGFSCITQNKEIKHWRNSFFVSLIFGLPSMITMLVFMLLLPALEDSKDNNNASLNQHGNMNKRLMLIPGLNLENLLMFLFSTPVQIFGGRQFYYQAFLAIKNGHTNMDVLIALATTVSYAYSLIVLVVAILFKSTFSPITFFDTTPMLMIFISLGRWLEHIARSKTLDALSKLLTLQPIDGCLVTLDKDGSIIKEEIINANLIKRGDLIKVSPGSKIPVDGIVVQGESECDQSVLTGEWKPVGKKIGSDVISGSFNQNGSLIIKATHVGKETTLSRIVHMVGEAQKSKAPVQNLADRIASFFVPVICTVSILTFVGWCYIGYFRFESIKIYSPYHHEGYEISKLLMTIELAFQFAITVLCVSCPCALSLATPTAVMVSTGVGAANGILIKGGEPLETVHKIKSIVFDKTGTITQGKPSVTKVLKFVDENTLSTRDFLNLIASAENQSEHSLAKAIVDFSKKILKKESFSKCIDFYVVPGCGLKTKVIYNHDSNDSINRLEEFENITNLSLNNVIYKVKDSKGFYEVLIGNRKWIKRNFIDIDNKIDIEMNKYESDGNTCVLCAINSQVIGLIAIADKVKDEANLVVYNLYKMNFDVYLLTGDNKKTAEKIAKEVGICKVFSEVLPSEKAQKIKEIKKLTHSKVAMIGDGINDSAALSTADIGIAIGTGADIAVKAASIVLIKNDLVDVITAIDLSKKTVKRIKLNFILASVYNLVMIPIAVGLFLPFGLNLKPWMASVAMALSSISVLCSSLMLKLYKKPSFELLRTPDYKEYLISSVSQNKQSNQNETYELNKASRGCHYGTVS